MTKQTKEKDEPRRVGPKFARNVIPENFQIRRPSSPMADLLDESIRASHRPKSDKESSDADTKLTSVVLTPVESTPVKMGGVIANSSLNKELPEIYDFLDHVLPRFPPPRQAILLRLYRWCEGVEREMVVSTPRLAAKTNMDEKVCRTHLHALIADGFLIRLSVGEQIAQFGGSDRNARGLILKLSAQALTDLFS